MTTRVFLVFMLVLLSSCVTRTRFRYSYNQPECFSTNFDPLHSNINEIREWRSLDCRAKFYRVAFIEFDEHGNLADPSQAEKAKLLIEDAKKRSPTRKVITFVYVHGWKNNAAQARPGMPEKDVERFERALSGLSHSAPKEERAVVPIVGIYIGWRGKSLLGPSMFTFPSFWPRRNAANRVGSVELAKTIDSLIETTNKDADTSRVLLLGHSFGARVLEHALATNIIKLYDRPRDSNFARPRVDLVLLVNSANDSRLALRRVENLRAEPIELRHPDYNLATCLCSPNDPICQTYPLVTAITSTGDSDTKYLLPIANTLWPDRLDVDVPPPTGDFIDRIPPKVAFARASAAHQRFFHSHDVNETKCPAFGEPTCPADSTNCVFAFKAYSENSTCYQVDRRGEEGGKKPYNQTAYWVMQVEPAVVLNHGDVWNQNFVDMLAAMMTPREFFSPTKPKMKLYVR